MVSIADVAARAGVSPTTVSHALSGKRTVSAHVRERVREAMTELGYAPRRAAQNLVSGRTRLIGLIVPDIANGFFAELARGVEQAAIESNYNVVLCTTGFDHAREVLYLETIKSRAVDGVVYAAGSPPTDSELSRLLGDLPIVLVDEEVPGASAPTFVSDNREGGRLIAHHLLDLGHRHAVVLAAGDDLVSSRERVAGFLEVWNTRAGGSAVVETGGFTVEGGRSAIAQQLGRFTSGTASAVFAANDLMALGAIERLEEAGLGVPADVSVAGFDDTLAARYSRPRLTTLRQDVGQLGRQAADRLVSALEGASALTPEHHTLPVELVIGDSTAAPRASSR